MLAPDGGGETTNGTTMKTESWIGQNEGWARPMDWNNPAARAAMLEASDREAADEDYHRGCMRAELGEVAYARRLAEFESMMQPDFADYSREHRAPEGAEKDCNP